MGPVSGAPGGSRTPGLQVRSLSLYPAELRARGRKASYRGPPRRSSAPAVGGPSGAPRCRILRGHAPPLPRAARRVGSRRFACRSLPGLRGRPASASAGGAAGRRPADAAPLARARGARVAPPRGGRRAHTAFAARADRLDERREARGGLDVPHRGCAGRRPVADPVQPGGRRRRPLRHERAAEGVRARRGHRPRALALRPLRRRRRGERSRREPRGRRLGRRRRAARRLQRGTVPLRPRRRDRQAAPGFRRRRPRRPARRARPRDEGPLRPLDDPRRRVSRPAHPRHARARGPGAVGAGVRARLRPAHRRHPLDVPHDPEARRARPRHVARGRVEDRRRRERLERHQRRRGARPRVPADRLARVGLLGRGPPRRWPLRQLRPRAARGHRRARVALPARPPRPVGPRSPAGARARHGHAGRPAARRGGADHEVGARVRLRPRDRRAALPRRGAPVPLVGPRRRGDVADAADTGPAEAVRAPAADRGRADRPHARGPRRGRRALPPCAQRRAVRPAEHARHRDLPRLRRRRRVGRLRRTTLGPTFCT